MGEETDDDDGTDRITPSTVEETQGSPLGFQENVKPPEKGFPTY